MKQWIQELFNRLRGYYKNVAPDSKAAQEFTKLDKQVQKQLADMFVEMSVEAGNKLSTIKEAGLLSELNEKTAPEGGRQYKLVAPFTDNKGVHYDSAVLLDTAFFDGLSPRNWGTKLRDFVKYRAEIEPFILPILDENGNIQQLEFAKGTDRVYKSGKSQHDVLDELSTSSDNISKLAVIHIDEIIDASEADIPYYTEQDPIVNHGWLDKNGWLHRTAYVINIKNGGIYKLVVDVAKADDGRHIMYATKGKINRVGTVQVNSLKPRGSGHNSNSNGRIAQTDPEVKRKDLEYQYAVSRGDLQTAQKMVDESATKDIRYKRPVQDSAGRALSEGQQEFFAESQARNFNGSLVSLFHGTENGGFTQFDPQKSDDKTTIFLTDNIRMAETYSGSTELIQLAKGKPRLLRWMEGDTTQGKGQKGVYNVYANMKNPLIVDAKGENWNNLSSKEGYGSVNFDVEVNDYGDVDWNNTSIRLTTKVNSKSQSQTFRSVDALNQYLIEYSVGVL